MRKCSNMLSWRVFLSTRRLHLFGISAKFLFEHRIYPQTGFHFWVRCTSGLTSRLRRSIFVPKHISPALQFSREFHGAGSSFQRFAKIRAATQFCDRGFELAGISLSWEDCADLGDHLLVILKLERVRVALALIDAGWRIAAVLQLPVVLQQCHPDDIVGPLEDVAIRVLRNSADSFEGLLWVERI